MSVTRRKVDEAAFLALIRGERRGVLPALARSGLSLAAIGYRAGVAARNFAYDRGWARIASAPIPIVSVGNLTLGGTGKTPMVEWIARHYRDRGIRVAILSRGYGGQEGLNDEGLVLDENLPDVPHLQDRDRASLATIAAEELEAELAILDDGFQHRRLGRDLDVVLLDALDPFGLGRMFPRGLLREPAGSLRRARVVVLSRADLITPDARTALRDRVGRIVPKAAWAEARHAPLDLLAEGEAPRPLEDLAGKRVAVFCGLGNPEGFRRTLGGLGVESVAFRAFPDHHPYDGQDLADLASWAREAGADLALTTQKDSVKLRLAALGPIPLLSLRIGLEVMAGAGAFRAELDRLAPSS